MGAVTIACKNGRIFSACHEDMAQDPEFLMQVGYYAIQGCVISTVPTGNVTFADTCGKDTCEHCQSLKHDVPDLEQICAALDDEDEREEYEYEEEDEDEHEDVFDDEELEDSDEKEDDEYDDGGYGTEDD